jgi:hypothetical protein
MAFNYTLFLDYLYGNFVETIKEQVHLFNAASKGSLILTGGDFIGGMQTSTFYPIVADMIHKRNIFDKTGVVNDVEISDDTESKVKIAAGTDRLITRPSDAQWINKSEYEAAEVWGQAVSTYTVKDMLHTAILAMITAMSQETAPSLIRDITSGGLNETTKTANLRSLNKTSGIFGDAQNTILSWIMHSTQWNDLIDSGLANTAVLFRYDTVSIMADVLGRPFIVIDAPYLVNGSVYSILGLTAGAVTVEGPNNYLTGHQELITGKQQLYNAMQMQWTYNLKVKGYSWNGGQNTISSPDDPAIGTSANWLKKRQSYKDLPGVILKCN